MNIRASIPLLEWLPKYKKEWFRLDLVAGLTTAAVVLPKAMAYATVAGLPLQVGLYTAFVPMLIYAVFGTSRPMSMSTTTTLAILTVTELGAAVPGGDPTGLLQATALLAAMVGAILIAASVLRLGFIANFISEPVLVGFKAGIAVVIIVDQLPKIFGIHFDKAGFLHNVLAMVREVPSLSWPTLAVGAGTVAVLVGFEHFLPKWPAPLIAVAAAIAGAGLLGWKDHGISLVGAIPSGLPPFAVPSLGLAQQLWPGAVGIALMSFTETIAAGRAFVKNDEPTPRPNGELLAIGLANLGGAFLGGMPAGGGTSQTAVNRLTGARTQVAGVVTALMTVLTMFLLAPLIGLMPHATLAGVVIVYSVGLISLPDFKSIIRVRRTEFYWAVAAFIGVMLLGTLQGIVVAVVISLVGLGYQMADPPVYELGRKPGTNVFRPRSTEHPEDETFPGLLLVRPEGRMFFLNAERVAEKVRALVPEARPRVAVLDLSRVFDLEYSALKMLTDGEQRQRQEGVILWLAGLNPDVKAVIERSPLGTVLGKERLCANLEQAVERFQASAGSESAPTASAGSGASA